MQVVSAKMGQSEMTNYNAAVNKAEGSLRQASGFLNEIKEQGEGRFMMNMLFKQFMNSFIREGIAITNAEKTKDGFINFYLSRLDAEIAIKEN